MFVNGDGDVTFLPAHVINKPFLWTIKGGRSEVNTSSAKKCQSENSLTVAEELYHSA